MAKDILRMSRRELDRLLILEGVLKGGLTQVRASEVLGISERQVRRLVKRIRQEGSGGIVHRSRGRRSRRKLSEERSAEILSVLRRRYRDFGPTLACEKLREREGIEIRMHRTDCLVDATDRLADQVSRPNTLGLVVSTYPAMAVCLANRHQGVRAVLGIDAARAVADVASVGANLLVVDTRTASFVQIKQMVRRMRCMKLFLTNRMTRPVVWCSPFIVPPPAARTV